MGGERRLLTDATDSAARVLRGRADVANSLADRDTKRALKQLAKPNSVSKNLKTAGVLLILAPEPVTVVPGAILVGASIALKRKDPAGVGAVAEEVRRTMKELGSIL